MKLRNGTFEWLIRKLTDANVRYFDVYRKIEVRRFAWEVTEMYQYLTIPSICVTFLAYRLVCLVQGAYLTCFQGVIENNVPQRVKLE